MSEILTVDRYDEITRAAGGVITHGEALMRLHAHDAALRLALAEATRERSLLHERVCELVSLLQTAERERDEARLDHHNCADKGRRLEARLATVLDERDAALSRLGEGAK